MNCCVQSKPPRVNRHRVFVQTGTYISDSTMYDSMHTLCYDDDEDGPWVYAYSPSKDFLSDAMKVHRTRTGRYVIDNFSVGSWASHVAIDPCISILPTTKALSDDQKVAAVGVKKMMSPKSKYKGANCRALKTTHSQGKEDIKVQRTPIFDLGKVRVCMCDPQAASREESLPARLNESGEIGKFIKNVLSGILEEMRDEYGWSRTPRTVVHDKASYMVAPRSQRLSAPFASALRAAKLKSWLGEEDADCSWLAGRLGDVYPTETLISHIRHGLSHRFPRSTPGETRARFTNRMDKVVDYVNSSEFAAREGGGLLSLAQALRNRCERMVELDGERLRA